MTVFMFLCLTSAAWAADSLKTADAPVKAESPEKAADVPEPAAESSVKTDSPEPATESPAKTDSPEKAADAPAKADSPEPAADSPAKTDSPEKAADAPAKADSPEKKADGPVKGMVTMIDLGAKKCIPCKMMAPILAELEKEYAGKAAIVFIDVWENPEPARTFGIRGIPTQIFFDKEGKEVFRHAGFMDKKSIVEKLRQMGVE